MALFFKDWTFRQHTFNGTSTLILLSKTLACLRREHTITLIGLYIKAEDDVLTSELTLNKDFDCSLPIKDISRDSLVFTPGLLWQTLTF